MESLKALSAEDREFFALAAEAASVNPFSDRYAAIISQLAGGDPALTHGERAHLMINRLGERVHHLDPAGTATLRQFGKQDRALLRYVFLFEVYHRFISSFDELIVNQLAAGEQSVPVPFAARALRLLAQRGFAADEARRFFAIFYQIRRAFYFIDRGLVGRSACLKQLLHPRHPRL
jgi:sigma-54 specific flagellar transcriptional regulator A